MVSTKKNFEQIMKTTAILMILLSLSNAEQTMDINRSYCALKNPGIVGSCLTENRAEIIVHLFRNCIMQIEYHNTLDELSAFVCKDVNSEEFLKYEKCMNPAIAAEAKANPKIVEIIQKCIKKAQDAE